MVVKTDEINIAGVVEFGTSQFPQCKNAVFRRPPIRTKWLTEALLELASSKADCSMTDRLSDIGDLTSHQIKTLLPYQISVSNPQCFTLLEMPQSCHRGSGIMDRVQLARNVVHQHVPGNGLALRQPQQIIGFWCADEDVRQMLT